MNTFTEVNKSDQIKYNSWSSHLNNTRELTNYSIRRMDLLIISISGAGIYIVFQTLKEIKTANLEVCSPYLLKLSGIIFLIAISANFVSQITGYRANKNEEGYALDELSKIEGKDIDECKQKQFDKNVNLYNKATDILNIVSTILMFAGLILLTIFNYYLF